MPNIIPYSFVTQTLSESGDGSTSASGAQSNIYDGNTGTYRLFEAHTGGDGVCNSYQTFECNWTAGLTVTNVYAYTQQGTYGGNYKQSGRYYYTYLKINGSWTLIDSRSVFDSQGSNTWYYETWESNQVGLWTNVTGARLYLHGYAYSYEGDRQQYSRLYMNEFNVNANLAAGNVQII